MSVLHHEAILETCLVDAEEEFRVSNKLTQKELDELLVLDKGTRDAIEGLAQKMFDDLCQ